MMRDGEEPAQRGPEAAEDGDDFSRASLDPPRATRSPLPLPLPLRGAWGRLATVAASTLVVALVVMGLFAHATSDPGGAITTLLRLPTATPGATFVPGANVIYFSNGAPWGALTIDGKQLPQADLTGYGIAVTGGAHHLVYQARYFPALNCVFSAPVSPRDTCPSDTSDSAWQFTLDKGLARVINLGSTGATLQDGQRRTLVQLANTQLSAQSLTTTIAPGDRYLDADGHVATATAPLHFTLRESLDGSAPGPSATCYQFCPDSSFSSSPELAGGGWLTRVTTTPYWSITDASGSPLTTASYQAGMFFPGSNPEVIGVLLTSAGWRITGLTSQDEQDVISTAGEAVSQAVGQVVDTEGGAGEYGSSFNFGPNPLDGCVMDVTYAGHSLRLLWRFGVLLAVDSAAHQVFPQLPVANAMERAVAATLLREAQQAQQNAQP